jgi:cytochrome b561
MPANFWPPRWAAPVYLMLFPLLGCQVATAIESGRRYMRAFSSHRRPNLFVAATRWDEAGKIDYALHGKMTVLCFALLATHAAMAFSPRPRAHIGEDALIVGA